MQIMVIDVHFSNSSSASKPIIQMERLTEEVKKLCFKSPETCGQAAVLDGVEVESNISLYI